MKNKKILILGYSGHGKDAVRRILANDVFNKNILQTSYITAEDVMLPWFDEHFPGYYDHPRSDPHAEFGRIKCCYYDRVNWRACWHEVIKQYNSPDKARLAKKVLSYTNVYVGMRDREELLASLELFDIVLWVDASKRLSQESSSSNNIHYDPNCMRLIDNNGSLRELKQKILNIAAFDKLFTE